MKEFKNISVGIVFRNTSENEMQDRLTKIRQILTEKGGNFAERENFDEEKNQKIVEFIARIPVSQYYLHHGFDSRLNKSWPDGCGAGWVTDSAEGEKS